MAENYRTVGMPCPSITGLLGRSQNGHRLEIRQPGTSPKWVKAFLLVGINCDCPPVWPKRLLDNEPRHHRRQFALPRYADLGEHPLQHRAGGFLGDTEPLRRILR